MTPRRRTSHGGAKIFQLFSFFLLTLYTPASIIIDRKGGETVKKKKKKPTKSRIDVRTIIVSAIVDFLVGLALLLIDKHT